MRRREFILLGGTAAIGATTPRLARAQQPSHTIGFLNSRSADETQASIIAFREGLSEAGFVEGRNLVIESRWAAGRYDQLPSMAADLVQRQVAVIATGGGPQSALAVKAATNKTPTVFIGGTDPVGLGLVQGLSRPGGNITGVLNIAAELSAKRLEILREMVPGASTIAVLLNPGYAEAPFQIQEIEAAARRMGIKLLIANVRTESEFEPAIASFAQQRAEALFVFNDPYFASQRAKLTALATGRRLPAIYAQREYAEAGGLMSYGTNFSDLYRQAGIYVGRILKGEKPADLPVMRPSRFELVINRKTAAALGVELPNKLLALADEVID